ncbi:MAG: T9SS type A sorting domain-containing protein, partial [Bacteroidales bacterium]|nr:T9SS type A sorting domain-containing protein [Bacteroidales bacterium]
CEPASEEVCWIVTGIEDPELSDEISVFPNPARDILNITSSTDVTHVTIMNYVGQVVYNQKVVEDNNIQVNVAGYETGVYMVKVETLAGILVKKVTIAH